MRSRRRWQLWGALIALSAVGPPPASAQSPGQAAGQPPDATEAEADEDAAAGLVGAVELAMFSGYYYRGGDEFGGTFNLQPTLTLGWALPRAELDLELWGAFPLHDRAALRDVRDEVDVTLSATVAAGERLELYAGLRLSFVPADGADPYTEILLGADWEIGAGFGLWGEATFALESETGVYFALGPAWSGALGRAFELELRAGFGGTRYRGDVLRAVEVLADATLTADLGAGFEAAFSAVYAYNPSARADVGSVGFALGYGW
ncbi:MAG: hypothetical protein R3F39_14680 [Myxococcota bacterium]